MREMTEILESVDARTLRLVSTDENMINSIVKLLFVNENEYKKISQFVILMEMHESKLLTFWMERSTIFGDYCCYRGSNNI